MLPRIRHFLGELMAQAQSEEETRFSEPGIDPSPLAASAQYVTAKGDLDLIDPANSPVDGELRALCRRYAGSTAAERDRMRRAVTMDDLYSLLAFSRRSAVFSMREQSADRLVDGFTAVSMIEQRRIDFRDAILSISLLDHAAQRIGAGANGMIQDAAEFAEKSMSDLMLSISKYTAEQRDVRNLAGHVVVNTPAGPGFAHWGFQAYDPTLLLDQSGLALARLLRGDRYHPASVTFATGLPGTWLGGIDDRALEAALASIRAGVTVSSGMLPGDSTDFDHQYIMMFLVEVRDERAVVSLTRLYEERQARQGDPAMLAAARGPLFCLAVARSVQGGVSTLETHSSMRRFETGIAAALAEAQPN